MEAAAFQNGIQACEPRNGSGTMAEVDIEGGANMNLDAEKTESKDQAAPSRTAGEAGWHVSRYNISAPIPDTNLTAIANLFKGNCARYTPIELYLLSVLEELDEHHPIIERFAKRGIIANFDERAALECMGRGACGRAPMVGLTICPTIGCNFDCPYCFQDHGRGHMTKEVQDDVIALTERMLSTSSAKKLHVTWFGGEPLLVPNIIESLSERLIALAEEHGASYQASIITNGYLLTQDIADMLHRYKVESAQITVDGLGPTHNATRYLRGGGPTFDRIIANLRDLSLPFRVNIRHNVHEDNRDEVEKLEAFINQLASESGNKLHYYPAPVSDSSTAEERGRQVGLLCSNEESDVSIRQESKRFSQGRGHYCGAHTLWAIGIDDAGNLHKCWEAVDKPDLSFGTAHDWDPADPINSASNADNLTKFLNTACPIPDEECRECVWLPTCVGGCPYRRLFEARKCIPFKDNPEGYVLALQERIGEDKEGRNEGDA